MAATTSFTLQDRSRFVRLLSEFSATKLASADYNLAERLGHFVGVSGSMTLVRGLQNLPVSKTTQVNEIATIHADVLLAHESMIRRVVESFSAPVGETHDRPQQRVPSIESGVREEALKTYEPYQRFYTAHQVEMAVGIKQLRDKVRQALSGCSVELHQLAELDKTLDESLEVHTRKQFNLAPKVLEQRFKELVRQNKSTEGGLDVVGADWLTLFYRDMRELLLAELDVRLQPVLGLLEALNEYEDVNHD